MIGWPASRRTTSNAVDGITGDDGTICRGDRKESERHDVVGMASVRLGIQPPVPGRDQAVHPGMLSSSSRAASGGHSSVHPARLAAQRTLQRRLGQPMQLPRRAGLPATTMLLCLSSSGNWCVFEESPYAARDEALDASDPLDPRTGVQVDTDLVEADVTIVESSATMVDDTITMLIGSHGLLLCAVEARPAAAVIVDRPAPSARKAPSAARRDVDAPARSSSCRPRLQSRRSPSSRDTPRTRRRPTRAHCPTACSHRTGRPDRPVPR